MPTPKFQPYKPGMYDDADKKIKGLQNAYIDVVEQLQYLLQNMDSKNVKRLSTEYTKIRSDKGETEIVGPLLVMKDKQAVPVIRLLMGYDAASLDFVYQLMNAAGDVTVNIDSNGNLTVERGTFKGSITIGTGNNVFKADGATGIWLGHTDFASAPFKVGLNGAATASNLTIVGGTITGSTIRTAASGSRTEISPAGYYTGLTQYDSNAARFFLNTTDSGTIMRFYDYHDGSQYQAGSLSQYGYNIALTQNSGYALLLGNSGEDTLPYGNWDCSGAYFNYLKDGSGYLYATQNWVQSQGYATQSWVNSNYYDKSTSDSRYVEALSGGGKTVDKIAATSTGLVIWFTDGTTENVLYD